MTKILLVDDEELIRDRMSRLLELDGYETFGAENGPAGLEICYKEKPDIALVDVKMPGMNGIEVLRKIKEKTKETEVIIITGHGGVDTAIEALREGAFSYVTKPVEYDELEIEIKRALERLEIQRSLDRHVKDLECVNAELDQIFNTGADGMRLTDKDFNVLRVNETFSTLSGVSKDEAVGKKCYEVFPGPMCHTADCPLTRILAGDERIDCDVEKERIDGTLIPCLLTAVPFVRPDGGLVGILESFKDISDRKRAENALRESEERLRCITSSAHDSIIMMDDEGQISYWNEAAEETFGYSAREVLGRELHSLLVPQQYHEAHRKAMATFTTTGRGNAVNKSIEVEAVKKDGALLPVELSISGVNIKGKWHAVGIVRDISERKKAEVAIREAHADLESLYQQLQREQEIVTQVFANVARRDDIESRYVKHLLSPMEIVGGDLILVATGPSGSQYVFLGDFTGHGLSAAMGAIPVSDVFYSMAGKGHSIAKIVTEINGKLKDVLPTGLFLCACFVELDHARGALTVWNGGLPDALIIGRAGGIKRRLPSKHLPLGVVGNDKLDTGVEIVATAQEDLFYAYSDGVIEATNKHGEMFGQERLEEHFANIEDPETLLDKISSSLTAFRSGAAQQDDIAIVEIRCDPGPVCRFDVKTTGEAKEVSTGWRLALEIGPESLRTDEALPHVMEMLMEGHEELHDHQQNIYLILSELFSNALEHGLLRLESEKKESLEGFEEYHAARERKLAALEEGSIKIDLELSKQEEAGKLVIRVEDSGPGFDYQEALPQLSDNIAFGGRGILLVRSLCQGLVYLGRGNQVEAVYVWS